MKLPKSVMDQFREAGRKGGLIGGAEGGRKAAANMTTEQLRARSQKALAAKAKKRAENNSAK